MSRRRIRIAGSISVPPRFFVTNRPFRHSPHTCPFVPEGKASSMFLFDLILYNKKCIYFFSVLFVCMCVYVLE